MVEQVRYASFDPETFVEGGGILNDVDGTITSARIVMFDYQGKADATPAIKLNIAPADGSDEYEQYWSLGSTQDWRPSEDGRYLVCINPQKEKPFLAKNSNGSILFASMAEKGVPKALLAGDISKLEGMKCHWIQIPDQRNLTKGKKTGKDGKQYDKTILVVSAVISLPTGSPATGAVSGNAGAAAAATTAAVSPVADDAVGILTAMVLEAGNALAKKDLAGKAMSDATLKAHPKKTEILQIMFKDEFIKANFNLENGIISMKS